MLNIEDTSKRNFLRIFNQQYKNSKLNPLNIIASKIGKNLPTIEPETLFLNRSSFGIRPIDYVHIKAVGIENYLEQQLDYQSIDNSELDDLLAQVYPLVDASLLEIINYIQEGEDLGEDRFVDPAIQLISSTIMRQLYSKHQLFEVMVEFWTNHFNIDLMKDTDLILKVYEDKYIIRANTLTSFRQILQADAKSTAMIFYLDNYTNTKFGPNENYARELLELHTLGVDNGYTEQDVKEVARCFTGWGIGQNREDLFEYYDENHDQGIKYVMGKEINNSNGILDGEQVLNHLADNYNTAFFISNKLVRRFCSDKPDNRLVTIVAKKYLSTDGDIKEMLRSIFHSPLFLESVDDKFKRPIEFVTSLVRTLDIESAQATIEQKFYPMYVLYKEFENAGQAPFFWSPPTGYPDVSAYWKNISSLLNRINFANSVALGDINFVDENGEETPYSELVGYQLEAIIGDSETPEDIVSNIENAILYRNLSQQDKQLLIEFLALEGEIISEQRIRAVIGIILSSTYFQLR